MEHARQALIKSSWRGTRTGRARRTRGIWACARRRCSGRAGSASGGRGGRISSAPRASSSCSTASGVLPGARPVRLATRKTWVSTAMVGWPKAELSTTFAVLRPTPGSFSSASRVPGTSPPCCSSSAPAHRDHRLGLVVEQADGLDVLAQPVLAERDHRLRVVGDLEQLCGRLVDAGVGRLGRQDHRDQQRVGVGVVQLGLGRRAGCGEAGEEALDRAPVHGRAPPAAGGALAGRCGAGYISDDVDRGPCACRARALRCGALPQPLARAGRLPSADGRDRAGQRRDRRGVRAGGRLAGDRLPRPRRRAALPGVPLELPPGAARRVHPARSGRPDRAPDRARAGRRANGGSSPTGRGSRSTTRRGRTASWC